MIRGPAAVVALTCAVIGVVAAGCGSSGSDRVAERAAIDGPGPASAVGTETVPPTTVAPTTTSTPPPEPVVPPTFGPGDDAPEVQAIQARLAQLGYRPGEASGQYSPATASAVMAFQKHEGLQRDGVAGPETQLALLAPVSTGAGPRSTEPGPRVEVDLDRQLLFVVGADGSVTILNTSTGSGQPYRTATGGSSVAYTPTGSYAVQRRVDAVEHAPLGILYRPLYFTGGFAVHGSPSVPAFPASHGCVRLSNADQDWLYPQAVRGTPVVLYA